jgi:IS30 family transposase
LYPKSLDFVRALRTPFLRPLIAGRPETINQRRRYGDWEGDTLVAAQHRGGGVSLVERKSLYTLLARVPRFAGRRSASADL